MTPRRRRDPALVTAQVESFGNDTIWDFLTAKNENDIKLYAWLKTRSLVKCDAADAGGP